MPASPLPGRTYRLAGSGLLLLPVSGTPNKEKNRGEIKIAPVGSQLVPIRFDLTC